MQFAYAGMWYLAALILIFRMGKENKIFYVAGAFFLILGTWWLLGGLYPSWGLFAGVWGVLLRIVTGVVLVALCLVYFKEKKGTGNGKSGGEK